MSLRLTRSDDHAQLEVVVRLVGADVQHVLRLESSAGERDLRRVVAAVYSAVQGLVTNDELRSGAHRRNVVTTGHPRSAGFDPPGEAH